MNFRSWFDKINALIKRVDAIEAAIKDILAKLEGIDDPPTPPTA